MASNADATIVDDDRAFDWVRSHTALADAELLKNSPWVRTYRLSIRPKTMYLKTLLDDRAPTLRPTASLAMHFRRHVPKVMVSNVKCGRMLSADHEGQPLNDEDSERSLRKLLRTHVRFQIEAVKFNDLLACLLRPDYSALKNAQFASGCFFGDVDCHLLEQR